MGILRSLLLAGVTAAAACGLAAQTEGTAATIPGERIASPRAVELWTYNAKGQRIGSAWALALPDGFVTVRDMLANAARGELVISDEERVAVDAVLGEDIEANLVRIRAAKHDTAATMVAGTEIAEREVLQVRCSDARSLALASFTSRDIPVFGGVYVADAAHTEVIAGCPVVHSNGFLAGLVVWESPFGKPSVAFVPAGRVMKVPQAPERSWEEWRAVQDQEGVALRNGLFAEGLQEIWRERYPAAISSMSTLLEGRPQDARGWYYRGYAKAMSGDRDGAMTDYEKAVELEPENAEMHFSLGFTYALLQRTLEAKEQLAALRELNPEQADRLAMIVDAMEHKHPDSEAPGLQDDQPTPDAAKP